MRFFSVFVCIIWVTCAVAQNPLSSIGTWKEFLPYNSAIDVAAGDNKIYCATPYSLFSVDISDHSVERFSRITGLAETGISAINYDEASQKLFIAYSNSNIDIIYRNDIFNIPDIKRENIIGDKTIYNIYEINDTYYLSTGLGIVVVDGDKYEIKDSWFIGNNGNNVKVGGFTAGGGQFFAATDDGLKMALQSSNLADYRNWQVLSGTNGLAAGACRDVVNTNDKIVVLKDNSLFCQTGTGWQPFYTDGNTITSINATSGKIAVCERLPGPVSRVVVLNDDATVAKIIQQNGVTPFPRKTIIYQGNYWVADQFNALSEFSANATADQVYSLNSPESIASGDMTVYNNVFYAAAGTVNDSWNYQYDGSGIYQYKDGQWKNYNRFHYPILDSVLDLITVAIDPRDGSVWGGSFGGGLLHITTDENFIIYKQGSPIQQHPLDPGSYRVAGLAFDSQNNLWISNFGSPAPLAVIKADGSSANFTLPFALTENAVSQIIIDDIGQLWIESPLGNGLVCFNMGSSIDDVGDDRWKLYRSGAGNGNLPSNNVLSLAKDKNGYLWVGTDNGIGVIQCPGQVFDIGCEAILPIVAQGNFAGYLFAGENVQSIAVDGADRKWVATKNGVWLVSPDGENVLERFTEDNSPLLSDNVKKITIDGSTGQVYFATDKGICAFAGAATSGAEVNSNVIVFPNPVPPNFAGTIGIRGLADNAIVKITQPDGRLIFQTRALGGQAVWDGRDYRGRKISTGVYLVLISTDDHTEKAVSKIVFISK